jgi:hypothetical protein
MSRTACSTASVYVPVISPIRRLHPVSGLSAEFPTPQRGFMGPMMTTLVDQFANMDGEGYGVRLEMAPVHPGLGATSLPWAGGREWKRSLARFRFVPPAVTETNTTTYSSVS